MLYPSSAASDTDESYHSGRDHENLVAEAFHRCSLTRAVWHTWTQRANARILRYSALNPIADQFRENYTKWALLKKWRTNCESQHATHSMSLVAWRWRQRRDQRRVLAAWHAATEQAVARRKRIQRELAGIAQEAEVRVALQHFFGWMGFAARAGAAATFLKFKTEKRVKLRCVRKWRVKWIGERLKQLQVEFLLSRTDNFALAVSSPSAVPCSLRSAASRQAVAFRAWFRFWAQRTARRLAAEAAKESDARQFHCKCLLKKAIFALRENWHCALADRIHRRTALFHCIDSWRGRFASTASDNERALLFTHHQRQRRALHCFRKWKVDSVLHRGFAQFTAAKRRGEQTALLQRWKDRLAEASDAALWLAAAASTKRQLVLRRGFDALLQSSARFSASAAVAEAVRGFDLQQQQQQQRGQMDQLQSSTSSHSTSYHVAVEKQIRQLLSQFQQLMLTQAADVQLVLDPLLPESVRGAAMSRTREREQLRAAILQLREALSTLQQQQHK